MENLVKDFLLRSHFLNKHAPKRCTLKSVLPLVWVSGLNGSYSVKIVCDLHPTFSFETHAVRLGQFILYN
jgi:hypothetical protein